MEHTQPVVVNCLNLFLKVVSVQVCVVEGEHGVHDFL